MNAVKQIAVIGKLHTNNNTIIKLKINMNSIAIKIIK